jgi:hypothetical protein
MFRDLLLLCMGAAMLAPAAALDCDRACLKNALDQYLNAVIHHDPTAANLLPGFRETENTTAVKAGTGLWQSATGLGKLQRRYMDAVSGQAGYFGLIEEKEGLAIVTLRVRVVDRKVSEAEWIISRKGDPGVNGPGATAQAAGNLFDPENLIAHPPPERVLPAAERLPREALMGIANTYFDGFSTPDSAVVAEIPGCARIENGITVTGRPVPDHPDAKSDCATNLTRFNVQYVAARRFPVVDTEAGVVLGMGVFIRKPGIAQRRNVLSEWFTIDHQLIRSIHAAMFYPSPEMPVPNWPPYNGNWPLTLP